MNSWTFSKTADGRWIWQYVNPGTGKEMKRCQKPYATLLECMNDAQRNGYTRAGSGADDNISVLK